VERSSRFLRLFFENIKDRFKLQRNQLHDPPVRCGVDYYNILSLSLEWFTNIIHVSTMLSPFWSVGTIPHLPSLNNTLWSLVPAVSNSSNFPLPNRALTRQKNLYEDNETDSMEITLTQGFVDTTNKDTTTSIHQEVDCKSVCKNLFYGRKQSCNRFIRYKFSRHGLGHQFSEFLFAAEFARTRNLSLHIAPFVPNNKHAGGSSTYSGIITLLGYHGLSKEFDMSMNVSEPVTQELLYLDPARYKNRCGISVTLTGYKYCKGTLHSDCFRDPKNAHLFQVQAGRTLPHLV
jgi:hypothetical protein